MVHVPSAEIRSLACFMNEDTCNKKSQNKTQCRFRELSEMFWHEKMGPQC